MENKVLGFSAIAGVLGIIAAATGFAAEVTRIRDSEVEIVNDECIYPGNPSLILAIASALFTIITRIYISVSFGGDGCCQANPNSTPISKLYFVFSWVASVAAVFVRLAAAGASTRQGGWADTTCYVVRPGIFAAGASLALFSVVFGIAAYVISTPPSQTNTNHAVAAPMGANVDPKRNPGPFPPQQYHPPQYHPPQYHPHQYPNQ